MTTLLHLPKQSVDSFPDKQQILNTLKSSPNPVSDVLLAAQFDTSCPRMRSLLKELEAEGEIVGDDGEWRIKEAPIVNIDSEFKKLIPPLTKEERSQLEENILAEGCRDPLTVWKGHNILLDGHNRYEICDKYGVEFYVSEIELGDREEAKIWILQNQLGRRNLSPDKASYYRGVLYNTLKARTTNPQGKNQHSGTEVGGKNFPQPNWEVNDPSEPFPKKTNTAEALGSQFGVTGRTIKNEAKYADSLEAIATHVGDEARTVILGGDVKLSKKDVEAIADVAKKNPDRAREAFKQTEGKDIVEQIKERHPVPFPYRVGDVCCISAKGEPALRKYSGCWGVILEVGEFFARIGVWDGEIESVKPYNLDEYSLSPAQKTEVVVLRDRLVRLQKAIAAAPRLETAALAVVADIGKKKEPYLSEIEEKLLRTLEKEYLDHEFN